MALGKLAHAMENRRLGLLRGGQDLVGADDAPFAVHEHEVGEGAPDIDGNGESAHAVF